MGDRTRLAVIAALALTVFAGGVTAGAVGSAMILGRLNDSGTRTTTVRATGTGAVLRVKQLGTGPALVVEGGAGGVGVDLRSGALRVAGAGLDTPTAAFTFRTDADDDGQNQCQSGGDHWFVIDNAMTNGRPGALLFLSALPDAPPASPVWLGTDAVGTCQQQRWGLSGPPLDAKNYRYNVLVIVP